MTTTEQVTADIKKIYEAQCEPNECMSIVRMAGYTDYTPAQISEALVGMARRQEVVLWPESNQAALTRMNHLYAVEYGATANHLILIES